MDTNPTIIFRRQIIRVGDSTAITIPPELQQACTIKQGDEACLILKQGKKGPYIAIYKEA